MKKFLALAFALTVFISTQAFAMDLASAKQAGYLGEKPDGLVGTVSPHPSKEAEGIMIITNGGRMEVYKETAKKQGVPLSQVQALAAEKLYSLTPSGQYIMTNGTWVKK